jgi:branched-subunit amino acid aminotransferase/4-amino-4-deoxychorismate lyase
VANHLTPDELADLRGVERTEIIATCVRLGVPVYHGKIDRWLFQVALEGDERSRATGPLAEQRLH